MTLRSYTPVKPLKRVAFPDWSNLIRVSSQPRANGWCQVFSIGCKIAAQIGMTQHRYYVDLLIDDGDPERVLAGFRKNADGQYLATRRGDYFWISIDAHTSARFFSRMSYGHIPRRDVTIADGAISFEVKPRGWA